MATILSTKLFLLYKLVVHKEYNKNGNHSKQVVTYTIVDSCGVLCMCVYNSLLLSHAATNGHSLHYPSDGDRASL